MDDSKDVNLIGFDVVDDTVRAFDHLPNLVQVVFRHSTAERGKAAIC